VKISRQKYLVLYTPNAAQLTTDVNGVANLAITQINNIFNNSGINNTVSLAGVVAFPVPYETGNIKDDIGLLSFIRRYTDITGCL
jgi:hypothetical protein